MRRAKTPPNDRAIHIGRVSALVRLKLDRHAETPLYRQIYERIAQAIKDGALHPGERLPSARSLASQLATSRGTIDLAYDVLSGEGYIMAKGAAGTIVSPTLTASPKQTPQGPPRSFALEPATDGVKPFQMGLPALDVFPRKLWSRLMVKHGRAMAVAALNQPAAEGYMPLREAIRSYLAISRGILCSTEQVVVTAGFQGALGLITRALLHHGDEVWFEDPGYFMARLGFEAAGAKLVPVPVDVAGLNVETGIAKAPKARFVSVTPSHQMPLGVSLSSERRLALLSWASRTGAWIIEDDYDSEFRYGSPPLPALKSLDESDRVIYVGTFSKVLFPGLRLGYIVVPGSAIGPVQRVCRLLHRDRPIFNQAVVADFMREGHFARHIRKMRSLYSVRRAAVAAALANIFDGRMKIEMQSGGMHLLGRLAKTENDQVLVARAMDYGLAPAALSPWRLEYDCGHGLLLNFTNIPEHAATEMVMRLKHSVESTARS